VKEFEYLIALKNVDLDAVEANILEAFMIYKGIERLCGDPNPMQKRLDDYGSPVSAYVSLKKVVSLCRHLTIIGEKKALCTEQVEVAQSHFAMFRTNVNKL